MFKNNWQKYLFTALLLFSFLLTGIAFAQNFGTEVVGDGLGGVLGEAESDPRVVAGRIINFALGFLGLIAILIIIYAGFKWMTSGGVEEKIAEAKKILIAGVIGLIIILSSWALATFVLSRFSQVINNSDEIVYNEGDTQTCGCNGYTIFRDGAWGPCIGGTCYPGDEEPTSCNANSFGDICSPLDNICAEGSYCDNNCLCQPLGQAGDSCNLNTEEGLCAPNDNFCGSYLLCDPDSCSCVGSPVITGISPLGGFCQDEQNKSCQTDTDCSGGVCNLTAPNGAAGNFLTIFGKNFGTYTESESRVVFVGNGNEKEALNPININPSCVNSWRDDQIIIAIPNGAGTGPIKVESAGLSDLTNDDYGPIIPDFRSNSIIRPGLCEINPNRGLLSSEVSYQGINLYNSNAYFGNYSKNVAGLASDFSEISGLSGVAKTPNIKAGESGSFVRALSNGIQEDSNYLLFTKDREEGEGAYISYFSPTSGNIGQYVTIFGSGFGSIKGATKVYFGDQEAVYDFPEVCLSSVWQDNQITVKVPSGLDDGDYNLSISFANKTINTKSINPSTFTFNKNLDLKTSLCKINPVRGPAETEVGLWGEYFGAVNSEVTVKFNGVNTNFNALVENDGRADYVLAKVPQASITGPVRVLKGGTYGNELNFSVGNCSLDSECGSQVCCPKGTYKEGQCSNSLDQCYVDIPSSVYEWNFNTNFNNEVVDENESCAGLAAIYGACFTGGCPNTPGSCSPYPGGQKIFSQDCSQDCTLTPGCRLRENNCYYDVNTDRCLEVLNNGDNYNCHLNKAFEFEIEGKEVVVDGYCNANSHWEIIMSSSCPEGFSRGQDDKCVDLNSSCSVCDYGLQCEALGEVGRCVAPKVCPSGTVCESVNGSSTGEYKCASTSTASCDCCCTVGQSARDCCSYEAKDGTLVQLECAGTCGSDLSDDGVGFGRCGGCAAAGDTSLERDLACNCTGSSGQYCETTDDNFPSGFCTDCSSLSPESCLEHAAFCCLDSKGTIDVNDDVCRGGAGDTISDDPSNPNFGYCAYYNCADNTAICASSYPVKIGSYSKLTTCEKDCLEVDPCTKLGSDFNACSNDSSGKCCFDAKTNTCSLGAAITSGAQEDIGYCAYYNCAADGKTCASDSPLKIGSYKSLSECGQYCDNPVADMGASCTNKSSDSCDVSACNAPGFSCLTDLGDFVNDDSSDCGACCCQPVTVDGDSDACKNVNEVLSCMPDKGNCSGANRGLCCGANYDSDCGNVENIGRGYDTCCEARPNFYSSSPEHLATGVCRNAVLSISFDQLMNFNSLSDNIILVEEKNPDSGLCPSGSMLAYDSTIENVFANKNLLARLRTKLQSSWQKLASAFSNSYAQKALANQPNENNLYCAVPGKVSIENTLDQSTISFTPESLLSPATNYYLLIKGDEELNSQTGIISLKGIGFNGKGYLDMDGEYIEGENIAFNGRNFKNSHIIKFSTLSSQGATAGICLVDRLAIAPSSYLFNTTSDALNSEENDVPGDGNDTFDTKADKDKIFAVGALSVDGQHLKPVSGYAWDYNFEIIDTKVASGTTLEALPINQYFVEAVNGVSDAETKIKAEINMNRFSEAGACDASASCSCSSSSCPENCCNLSFGGDGFNTSADIYVFVCSNPWPKVKADGGWVPWSDQADNCNLPGSSCPNFNYKFYYCRDAGGTETFDDLPAILNQPVVIGQTNSLVCSSDKSISCTVSGDRCGLDNNNDGLADGVCVWDVLKESYFFRESIPSSSEITSATSLEAGGGAIINWRSGTSQVDTYKVYYLRAGQSEVNFKEYSATNTDVCQSDGQFYNCSAVISGLDNNTSYVFKVGVISANKAESQAANEKIVSISDKVAPTKPLNLRASFNDDKKTIIITWDENNDDTVVYRLYRGLNPGVYGDYYETNKKDEDFKAELQFLSSDLASGLNYFAISAFDPSANESPKSNEVVLEID
ncbi:IPT/TIG domain-containing protein [Patescibacteria group bacterium]|nr:IPT/TIG domain-containing protein [Patescibacteria group bacterium]